MCVFAQGRACCRKVRVDLGGHPEAAWRFELLQGVERAHGHGLTLAASPALLGLPRSTLLRLARPLQEGRAAGVYHPGKMRWCDKAREHNALERPWTT